MRLVLAHACPAAEIIKRRVPDIHQTTEISSITIVDVWEPKEEGLDTLETQVTTRRLGRSGSSSSSSQPQTTRAAAMGAPTTGRQCGPSLCLC